MLYRIGKQAGAVASRDAFFPDMFSVITACFPDKRYCDESYGKTPNIHITFLVKKVGLCKRVLFM